MSYKKTIIFLLKAKKIFLITTFLFLLIFSIVHASGQLGKLIIGKPTTKYEATVGDATLFIDGSNKGQLPKTMTLAFGEHKIVIKKEGFYDWEKVITISPETLNMGGPFLREINPGYGRLQVNSEPEEAEIHFNDDDDIIGYTPFASADIKKDKYKLTLKKPDYHDFSQDISISSGKVTKLDITLKSVYGKIDSRAIPINAEVYLDGEKIDDYFGYFKKILTGEHVIKIRKYGYQEWSQKIIVDSGKTAPVNVSLIPAYGFIKINSQPDNAEVFLNNDYFGLIEKEKTLNDIFPDEYKITLTKTGYKDWTKEIEVFSYNTTFVSAQLEPWRVTLNLTSEPLSAQVYLNNKYIDVTPLVYDQLTYGTHQLRLEMKGYFPKHIELEVNEREDIYMDKDNAVHLEKNHFDIFLAVCLILPAIVILYYLFFFSAKKKKKEELDFNKKETILNEEKKPDSEVMNELASNREAIVKNISISNEADRIDIEENLIPAQNQNVRNEIREILSEEESKQKEDDSLVREYREIQEKMEEQAHIRTLLSHTKEKIEKSITQAKSQKETTRLVSLQAISSDLDTLSQQFEYGKLSADKIKQKMKTMENSLEDLKNKKTSAIKEIKPKTISKKTRAVKSIREKK